jgi:hypothetical protein
LESFGRWVDESLAGLAGAWRNIGKASAPTGEATREAADAAGRAALDAATSVGRLPGTRMISGRQACPPAPNGAPDCASAAQLLCKGQGFAGGSMVDSESAEKCSAAIYVEHRAPRPGECRTDHVVTRALCQ